MKSVKEVFNKEVLKNLFESFTKELNMTSKAAAVFGSVYAPRIGSAFVQTLRRKDVIAMGIALSASFICASILIGANLNAHKITLSQNRVEATQILGNEKQVATNTLFKKEVIEEENVTRKEDVITRTNVAYTMENRELLAQMMFAEEGVFFSWSANDPDTIERVHKLAGSVILHRLNQHFSGAQTLADILYAPGQYDYRTIECVEAGRDLPELVYVWADELLTEGALGPENLVFQAEFPQGTEIYDHIGNQYFCCR